ncbi:hypothetical protein [Massilia cavernae]|uniref:Uncharacterized protein n=1 Tax=Massilia cavernae TaxID=2320864 RepID=A0A418XRB5_9BURK|nr:hypothetical protein [Massilia cavernae]RJG15024.1 hypothetical protein D3872_14990 [Massilia cavernae]
MPVQQAAPPKGRYIIRAKREPAPLATFIESIRGDPDIALVDTIGPAGQVHTAVIEIAAYKALEFERRFSHSDELMIERDQPLSLFD